MQDEHNKLENAQLEYQQLISIFDNIDEVVYVSDPDTYEVLYVNQTVKKICGEVVGKKCYQVFQNLDSPCPFCTNKYIFGENIGKTYIWDFQNQMNHRWYHCIDKAMRWLDGRLVRCEISIDTTERGKMQEQLKESEEKFRTLFENAIDGILVADVETKQFFMANKTICQMLGYTLEEIKGLSIEDIHPKESLPFVREQFDKLQRNEIKFTGDIPVLRKDGSVFYANISGIPIILNGKKYLIGDFRDITERKKAELEQERLNKEIAESNKKLKQIALIDAHTGLYNHRYLQEVIEREFYRAKRYAHPVSVIMLDLDYFKSVNDVYGHVFGDLVLKQLAKYLNRMVRAYDIVTRYGGEEFVILSPGVDRANALNLAQRLLEALNLYNFGNEKHTVKLKLSLAVVSYPEDKILKGMDLVELTSQILNKAKESGGNRVYSSLDLKKEKSSISKKTTESKEIELLRDKLTRLTKKSNQSLAEAIFAFAKTIELKDHYTGKHVERTVHYATEISRTLNLPNSEIELIRQAAILHDLGKIGISENILCKKAKLSKKELEEIRKHPQIGVDIIRPIQFLHALIPLILYHHERWDGKGYPYGLKGDEIPIGARIVAIADVYQALISERPYRKAYSKAEAIKIIKQGSGTQFDPSIVTVFLSVLKQIK